MSKTSEESTKMKNPHRFMGVPRDLIEWFPTIDYSKCNGCGDCAKFCAHGVYGIEDGRVVVENPKNCVVFCQACLKMCPIEGAMVFQTKKAVLRQIREIKAQMKKGGSGGGGGSSG
ncbi:MAG: ATP-binding protein [Promethearchaeota archaeon]